MLWNDSGMSVNGAPADAWLAHSACTGNTTPDADGPAGWGVDSDGSDLRTGDPDGPYPDFPTITIVAIDDGCTVTGVLASGFTPGDDPPDAVTLEVGDIVPLILGLSITCAFVASVAWSYTGTSDNLGTPNIWSTHSTFHNASFDQVAVNTDGPYVPPPTSYGFLVDTIALPGATDDGGGDT